MKIGHNSSILHSPAQRFGSLKNLTHFFLGPQTLRFKPLEKCKTQKVTIEEALRPEVKRVFGPHHGRGFGPFWRDFWDAAGPFQGRLL